MTPETTKAPVRELPKVLTTARRCAMLELRGTNIGCEVTTSTSLVQVQPAGALIPDVTFPAARGALVRGRFSSVPLRKANSVAGSTCVPSLTSRGRLLTDGVEVLFRDSNDERRLAGVTSTRMKSMTIGPYLGLLSPRVPASGGSREAACLMGKGGWNA